VNNRWRLKLLIKAKDIKNVIAVIVQSYNNGSSQQAMFAVIKRNRGNGGVVLVL